MTGLDLIAAERLRQLEEGYTPEHDEKHNDGSMAWAAACCAAPARIYREERGGGRVLFYDPWPWVAPLPTGEPVEAPQTRERELVRAGALIAAEIDRLRRVG